MQAGQCKHFTGLLHKACAAGVEYKELPMVIGKICLVPNAGHCDKYQEPTAEEINDEETEKWMAESLAKMAIMEPAIRKIKEKYRGKDMNGTMTCPICKKPKGMHIRHAGRNGHIHVWCETEGCIRFME